MRILLSSFLVALMVAVIASPAAAQAPRAAGPFAGLFGGEGRQGHTLDIRGALFAAYQDMLTGEVNPLLIDDPRFTNDDAFLGANGSLAYGFNKTGTNSSASASAEAGLSRYTFSDINSYYFSGGGGISTRLAPKVSVNASGNAAYSPFFSPGVNFNTGLVPFDPGLAPDFAFATVPSESIYYSALFGVASDLSRRSSLSGSGMWQSTQLLDDIAGSSRHLSGDFMFRHSITRRLGFHAGYGRSVSTSDLPGSSKFVHDNFDFGLDYAYDGSLKLGPRTTATFGTATGVASNGQDYRFRLNGHAGITRGIGRTWGASAYYIRDSGFEAGFADFVFTDSLTGSFSGLITERLSFNSGVYWTRGEVGFDGDSYTNMSATSSLSYGLFTNVGAYAQYTYQNSEYPAGSTVFLLPGRMNRQSVSAGLSAWLPLIKTRRGRP